MNFQICLAVIYFNIGIYAWRPLFRSKGIEQRTNLNLANTNIEENNNINKNDSHNLTNHTFMDDEEFMKLLRFYRPI